MKTALGAKKRWDISLYSVRSDKYAIGAVVCFVVICFIQGSILPTLVTIKPVIFAQSIEAMCYVENEES